MSELRFDGKVVVVTGAGRNLGREYALMFAARGARVLVNDLGVGISDTDGVAEAPVEPPADAVVEEIRAAGGEAVANRDTIATPGGGRAIVDAALDAFGAVDVVVNNAGQVRMAPFPELTEAQLDAVIDTQLRGALNVGRPAWAVMAERGGGRFVNVSSGAAFGGVPGGAVYGMAKMGVIGLTRAMASEGRDVGIAANVIAPYAKTRPGTGFGPYPASEELNEWLAPRLVAPLVGWLAHDACPVSGECFSVGGGHYARVGLEVTEGLVNRDATVETIAAGAAAILDSPATPITTTVSDNMRRMFEGFRPS
ncbi:MAG TPA: SDR family NAD(P)-dependent oxidoreductase [Acidimicrobiia bacterium]|nr:SDR family NAD(P)-dependent oxidoreductase [Acidimicrobiia bacterium]